MRYNREEMVDNNTIVGLDVFTFILSRTCITLYKIEESGRKKRIYLIQ